MQATLCRAPLLPARARAAQGLSTRRGVISCSAVPKQQQYQAQQQQKQKEHEPVASAALALSSLLLAAPAALADEAADAADAATGLTPLGWTLVVSPVIFYGLFNVYRSAVDPRAKFSDAAFIFAATIIVGNIVAITAFKTRLF